jgi:hypothetical protein
MLTVAVLPVPGLPIKNSGQASLAFSATLRAAKIFAFNESPNFAIFSKF